MNILNRLTIKHLCMNKRRTIVTIIGIILSCSLMVGLGTIASSFREYLIHDDEASGGKWHAEILGVPYSNYKYIETFLVSALIYLFLTTLASFLLDFLEGRLDEERKTKSMDFCS